jgi:hypothetical protein
MPVVVPSWKSLPRTLLTGPGIPTQVVVPSVLLAAFLQGTARTVSVETPSDATLSKPVSVAGSNGLPTSGAPPETAGGGMVLEPGVCAKAADAKRANAAATEITRIGEPPMNDRDKETGLQKVPRLDEAIVRDAPAMTAFWGRDAVRHRSPRKASPEAGIWQGWMLQCVRCCAPALVAVG